MQNLNKHEPDPITNDGIEVWPVVIGEVLFLEDKYKTNALVQADMTQRNEEGIARYGVPLTTHNGRNPLIDAYQEVLDAAVYSRQALLEMQESQHKWTLAEAYANALIAAQALRKLILETKGE